MRRKVFFLIGLCISLFVISVVKVYDTSVYEQNLALQENPGLFQADSQVSPFEMDIYLAGEWEYYPDEWIYSDYDPNYSDFTGSPFGTLQSFSPMELSIEQYYNRDNSFVTNTYALQHTSTELNTEADHISLPSTGLFAASGCKKASYRAVLTGLEQVEDGKRMLCLSGLPNGNIRIYINGVIARSMSSPYAYPVFYLNGESVEIVIEVTGTSQIFNLCPRAAFIGIAMPYMDATKSIYVFFAALLIAVLLILVIVSYFTENRQFRFYAVIGLLFSFSYIISECWLSGSLDTITQYVSFNYLVLLSHILILIGIAVTFHALQKYCGQYYKHKFCVSAKVLYLAAICLRISFSFFACPTAVFVVYACFILAPVVWWAFVTVRILQKLSAEQTLFHFGTLALLTGTAASLIHEHYGFPNIWIHVLPLGILLFIVLTFSANCLEQKLQLIHTKKLLNLEKESLKMQTSMLTNQIKPHFLYNTLTTIQEMCYTEPENAAKMIVKFSRYLRSNIDFMNNDELIPFSRELEHIKNYMDIQNERFKNSFHFETDIKVYSFLLPPLSVQPLIENGMKYGIRTNSNRGRIVLRTYEDTDYLYIVVENSGPGFNPENVIQQHHSIENIRLRLDSLLHAQMIIDSQEGRDGTRIEIRIPCCYIQVYNGKGVNPEDMMAET